MGELNGLLEYVKKLCQDIKHHEQQVADVRAQMAQLRRALQQFSRASQQDSNRVSPVIQTASIMTSVRPPLSLRATRHRKATRKVARPTIGIFSSAPVNQPMHPPTFPVPISKVRAEQQKCPAVRHLLHSLQGGCEMVGDKYTVSAGLVYRKAQSSKPRLYVPSSLVTEVLRAHTQLHGKQGLFKTYRQLHAVAFWPRLWSSIKNFLKTSDDVHGDADCGAPRSAPVRCSAPSRSTVAVVQPSLLSDPTPTSEDDRYSASVFKIFHSLVATNVSRKDEHFSSDYSEEDDTDILCYPG